MRTQSNNKLKAILIFILYPLLSLPLIWKGIKKREVWAYVLAAIFFGFLGILYPPAGDMYRYTNDFNFYKELDWSNFLFYMNLKFDYFLPLLSWSIGKLDAHPDIIRFIFVTCAYCMLFNLYHDITESNKDISFKSRLFTFFLVVPLLYNVYLFRMGLAQVTLVYGIYWYLLKNRIKGIYFILLSAIIHVSYIPFIVITFLCRLKVLNFSKRTFVILCFFLIFLDSFPIGVELLRSLPFSASLLEHIEEYLTGTESGNFRLSLNQIIKNQFSNIVFYMSLYLYYNFYKNNPQPMRIKSFINIFILIIILSSSVPVLHYRMLAVLKTFLIISAVFYYKSSRRNYKLLKTLTLFTIINIVLTFWQLRFYIRFGQYDKLFTSSSITLISFHYSDEWISKNVDERGYLIEWLKLGYKPQEKIKAND